MPSRPPSHRPPRLPRRPQPDDRPSAARRGYGHRWQRYRLAFLTEHPLCEECRKDGRLTPATDVDHVKPVTGPDDPTFWQPEGHQAMCHACHSAKTARENA